MSKVIQTSPYKPYLAWYTSGGDSPSTLDEHIACAAHARKLRLFNLHLRPVADTQDTARIFGYTCHYCDVVKRLKDEHRYYSTLAAQRPTEPYWTYRAKDILWRLDGLELVNV